MSMKPSLSRSPGAGDAVCCAVLSTCGTDAAIAVTHAIGWHGASARREDLAAFVRNGADISGAAVGAVGCLHARVGRGIDDDAATIRAAGPRAAGSARW